MPQDHKEDSLLLMDQTFSVTRTLSYPNDRNKTINPINGPFMFCYFYSNKKLNVSFSRIVYSLTNHTTF
jgi:hypothetical protein